MKGLEHSIKMDELLMSWLGKDQVYSKVLSLIEGQGLRNSGESHPATGDTSAPMTAAPANSHSPNHAGAVRAKGTKSPNSVIIPLFYRPPGTVTPDGKKGATAFTEKENVYCRGRIWELEGGSVLGRTGFIERRYKCLTVLSHYTNPISSSTHQRSNQGYFLCCKDTSGVLQ